MKKIIKQTVGVDVAQDELVVRLGRLWDTLDLDLYASKDFKNNYKGFASLLKWVKEKTLSEVEVRFVMEATGVYHERFAYFLSDHGKQISIILPNKISNYFRTLDVKTITDKTASEAIARFGLERKLDTWKKPSPLYKSLRQLTRERDQILQEQTEVKNKLHAEKTEAEPNPSSIKRMKIRLKLLKGQRLEIDREIKKLIQTDKKVAHNVELITSIPGLGVLTATTILAETNGFDLIRNKKQVVSFAGLDVKEKQSGTSVKGKPRISKKGNRYLRKSLYMPGLSAQRYNDQMKNVYVRLVSKHGIKKKAGVAVQRKLLELSYILVKNQTPYDPNYQKNREQLIQLPPIQADIQSP